MAENFHSIRERAAQFARKGQLKRAVQEYEKLIKLQPSDARTLHQFGELLARAGQNDRAVEIFLEAAAAHRKAGFAERAVAVLKQALALDPLRLEANLALAEALLAKQFERDAAASLLKAADALAAANLPEREIELLQRAVELLPNDTRCKVRLGRALKKQGRQEEARELIFSVSTQQEPPQEEPPPPAAPAPVAPQPPPEKESQSPLEAATEHLQHHRLPEAQTLLEQLLRENSGNLQVLELLAECHLRAGKPRMALPLCKRLARLAKRKGDERRLRWALDRVNELSRSALPPPLAGGDRPDESPEVAENGEEDTSG